MAAVTTSAHVSIRMEATTATTVSHSTAWTTPTMVSCQHPLLNYFYSVSQSESMSLSIASPFIDLSFYLSIFLSFYLSIYLFNY
jgi:hypothetical protein